MATLKLTKKGVKVSPTKKKREVEILSKKGDFTKPTEMQKTEPNKKIPTIQEQKKEIDINQAVRDRGTLEKVMDTISAPLSKPMVTLKEGIGEASKEVAKSREEIKRGDTGEALKVIGTTLGTTAVVGGAVLGAGALLAPSQAATIKLGAESIGAIRTGIQNRAIVGKLVEMGGNTPTVAVKFATNLKTTGLTTSWLTKLGGATALIGIIGSYPFAGFIKEEALQTLGFATNNALQAGDLEGAQKSIDEVNEILNPSVWNKIFATIPYANIVNELRRFYNAAATKNEQDQRTLEIKRTEQTQPAEPTFSEERAKSDEESKQRELTEMQWKAEYYQLIRDGKFQEADELLKSQEQPAKDL